MAAASCVGSDNHPDFPERSGSEGATRIHADMAMSESPLTFSPSPYPAAGTGAKLKRPFPVSDEGASTSFSVHRPQTSPLDPHNSQRILGSSPPRRPRAHRLGPFNLGLFLLLPVEVVNSGISTEDWRSISEMEFAKRRPLRISRAYGTREGN